MKLSFAIAEEIRSLHKQGGISQHQLAAKFGCDQSRISLILSGKIWGPRELKNIHLRKHGHATKGITKVYDAWRGMKARCVRLGRHNSASYVGRGIKVCDRWLESFENFLADVGEPPTPKHTLDRVDNNRGYEPGNVRWATLTEQRRNRRDSLRSETVTKIRAMATSVSYRQIARELGLAKSTVARIATGKTWRNLEDLGQGEPCHEAT